jgi:hypothetical protein
LNKQKPKEVFMKCINKIGLAASFSLIVASMASAQAVGSVKVDNQDWANYSGASSISFSVKVDQTKKIHVIDEEIGTGLGNETVLAVTATGNAIVGANLIPVGSISVLTNLAAWDITVKATNVGKLKNIAGADFLKRIRNGVVSDVVLRVNACIDTSATAPSSPIGATPASALCTFPTGFNIAQYAVINNTGVLNPSLSSVLGRTGGFKMGTDINAINGAHIGLYAGIEASPQELAGDGTYRGDFEFTLVSWY